MYNSGSMLIHVSRIALVGAAVLLMSSASLHGETSRKQPDDLPAVRDLPDLLVGADGAKLTSKEQWPKRRDELLNLVLTYEYGHLPPATPVSASEQTWKPEKSAEKGEAKRAENSVPLPDGAK